MIWFPTGDPGEPGGPAAQSAPDPAGHRQPAVRSRPPAHRRVCSLSLAKRRALFLHRLTLGLFFLFTALHLFSNYKAVSSVVMETLNESRLSIVLRRYLVDGRVLTPPEANQREPVFFGRRSLLLSLETSLSQASIQAVSPSVLFIPIRTMNNK